MNSSIKILTEISKKRDDLDRIRIISGTARGADKLGEQYAKIAHYELSKFPADWDGLGKRAGYIRNAEMAKFAVEDGNYGVLISFEFIYIYSPSLIKNSPHVLPNHIS